MFVILSSILLSGLTSSPYLAVGLLVGTALLVRTTFGVSSLVWPFFLVRIVFVGGIIVLFLYMTSLMTSSKISWVTTPRTPWALFILVGTGSALGLSCLKLESGTLWVEQIMRLSCVFLTVFLILFLLTNLITVCSLCQKCEGPMKSLTATTKLG